MLALLLSIKYVHYYQILKKYIVLRIRLRLKLVSFSDFMIEMFLIEMNFFIEMNFSIKTKCFLIEMNRPCHGFRRHLDE